MKRVSIKPHWTIRFPDGRSLPPRLLELLAQVQDSGSLSAACQKSGTSYRHAWDLIRQGETMFGAELLQMERGRGSRLTSLGQKLVQADQRIQARLSPALESLASELETEIETVLHTEPALLRIHASHGFAVETLFTILASQGVAFERKYVSSLEAPAALRDGACDLAGFHIPLGAQERPALEHYRRWMDPSRHAVIDMATRRQGLMVAAGNPLKIYEPRDLLRPDVRFINRQRNSGTRFLLEGLMAEADVDSRPGQRLRAGRVHACGGRRVRGERHGRCGLRARDAGAALQARLHPAGEGALLPDVRRGVAAVTGRERRARDPSRTGVPRRGRWPRGLRRRSMQVACSRSPRRFPR